MTRDGPIRFDLPRLPPRKPDAHKGDFGRILVVAGSRGMTGAACLCGEAALRSGAGLVTVAVPETEQPIVASRIAAPCMTAALPGSMRGAFSEDAVEAALELAVPRDVVALGPGFGGQPETSVFARSLLERLVCPCVVDADALNALVGHLEHLRSSAAGCVLTPHPGEMARLLETDTAHVQSSRTESSRRLARDVGAVVVLKGAETVISDGERLHVAPYRNPGMASGGTGDVLTGVVAALIGQGLSNFEAAVLAVHVHGLAGELARRRFGEVSMTAIDVLERIPDAFLLLG